MKAADLIGKEIIMGTTGAKYVVNSVKGDKLICDFENPTQGMSSKNMPVPFANVQKFIADGKWTVADANEAATTDVTTEADVQEVQDIVPVVTPRAKSDGGSKTADAPQTSDIKPQTSNQPAVVKPIGEHGTLVVGGVPKPGESADKPKQEKPKQDKPKQEKPQAKSVAGSTYRVELLPTKDGKQWPKLYGFKDENGAKKLAGKMAKTVTYSWDRDEQGEKRFYLKGGKKYCETFQQLADALNAGDKDAVAKVCKATVAVYEGARSEGRKKSEGRGKTEDIHQPSAISHQTSKGYSSEDVAAMLRKVLAGGDVPEDIKKLLQAA